MAGAKPISDEAVKEKTGKVWADWFRILDKASAKKMTHTQMAAFLHDEHGVPGWWCQMVAVRYEQERGLRKPMQTCTGDFAANGSRTLAAPLAKVFRAVEDATERRKWCPDAPLEVTSVTPGKYVRAKWSGSEGRVAFYFEKQESGKSRVAVDHMGLPNAKEALRMKAWWGERLDRLRGNIEGKSASK